MTLGLVGRKVGMTRVFDEQGVSVPVTVLDMSANRVTQVKSKDADGYTAVQVTFGQKKANRVNKAEAGHFAKAGVEAGRGLIEFALTEEKLAERKVALQRSEDMLLKAQAKKEKIVSIMNRPKKEPAVKLTPEERAAKRRESLAKAREVKKAEREKLNALLAAIEESGKSVDEIVAELKA